MPATFHVTETHNQICLIPAPTDLKPNPAPILKWEQKPDPFTFKGEISHGKALNSFLDMAWAMNHPGN